MRMLLYPIATHVGMEGSRLLGIVANGIIKDLSLCSLPLPYWVGLLALSSHSCRIAATIAKTNCSHDNTQLEKNDVPSFHLFLLRWKRFSYPFHLPQQTSPEGPIGQNCDIFPCLSSRKGWESNEDLFGFFFVEKEKENWEDFQEHLCHL